MSSSNTSLEKINDGDNHAVDVHPDQISGVPDAEKPTKIMSPTEADPSLPPVDGGTQAWLFLAGCYVMEALVFGTPAP
jgi:hypothetical protein